MGSRDVCLTNVCLEDIRAEGEGRPVFLRWESKCGLCSGENVLPRREGKNMKTAALQALPDSVWPGLNC